jgi:uncharacterized protein (DUF1778 family)
LTQTTSYGKIIMEMTGSEDQLNPSAAISEASRVLADRTRFELDQPAWDDFMKLLDRPAQVLPGLQKLFSKPSVFE